MAKKTVSPYVVGKWNSAGAFEPTSAQPEAPITDLAKMIVWVKKVYGDQPGAYEFVRRVPGALTVAVQQEFSFKFG